MTLIIYIAAALHIMTLIFLLPFWLVVITTIGVTIGYFNPTLRDEIKDAARDRFKDSLTSAWERLKADKAA